MIMHTPMSLDIRAEVLPGTPLMNAMPNIYAQPKPGINEPSRRDIFLGIDLVDTLSGGLGAPIEQGNVTVERIEVRTYNIVAD